MSGYYVGTHGRNADVLVMTTQGVVKGDGTQETGNRAMGSF